MDSNIRMPTIKGSASVVFSKAGQNGVKTTEVDLFQEGLPEEIMDEYKKLVGDGLASVTVGVDMGLKNFGNGATSTVFVKLTCDQSANSIQRCFDLANHLASHYADQARQQAETKLQTAVNEGRTYFRGKES